MTNVPGRRNGRAARADVSGLTLVELMIAMMLGLLVVGSASAIFISNRQTYRATEGLGRVQENGRMAFEIMARDLREAGGNPCGNADRKEPLKLVNVLNSPASQWWSNWNNGIIGYEATMPSPPANRVTTADAIALMSGDNSTGVTVVKHNPTSANFQLNTVNHTLDDADIAIVCDWRQASLFQVSNAQPGTNEVIVHNVGNTVSPGNCSKGLGYANPPVCTTNGTPYEYGANSMIVRLHAVRWYIGTSAAGRSLFRSTLINTAGALAAREQEIAEGVTDMQLLYLLEGGTDYVDATTVTAANRWNDVTAVRVLLDIASADRAGIGNQRLTRRIAHTVTLRNRME